MRVPWKAKRSNQSNLKEINPEYSSEGQTPKLKLQYFFCHLIRKAESLEKALMLGKTEGRRRRGQQRVRWFYDITDPMDMDLGKLLEMVRGRKAPASCSPRGGKELDTTWRLNTTNQI